MRAGGFVPFTTTDYLGALAAVVFCQGCPWRCGYCHNPHLIPVRGDDEREFTRIVDWLESRRGLLDAVVFSGGEPTTQVDLIDAIAVVRALGFEIGLHTGGAYPRRLARVLPLLDWVGIDVKAPVAEYATITGVKVSGIVARETLDLVIGSGIAHEVRTTVHPALTPPETVECLARELAEQGVTRWVLQPFRARGCADLSLIAAASHDVLLEDSQLAQLRAHVPVVEVRLSSNTA